MTNKYIFNYKIIYTLTFVLLGVFVLSGCSGEFFISLKYHFIKTINQDEKKSLIKCGIYNNKTACKEVDKIFNEKISNSYIERITTDYLNRFNGYLGPLEDISISELTNLYSLDLNDDPNYSANNPLRNLKDVKKDFRKSVYYFFEYNNTENQGLIFRIEKNICNQLNNANVCKIVALKQLVNLDGSDEIEIEQSGKLTVLERINQYIAYNKKACNLGNFYSCNEIARQYRKGIFVNKNYYTAFNLLKRGFEDQMIFLKKERDELRDRLPAYCLENNRFNTYDTSNIMYVDEWHSNNFSSILSLSLDKNTPNNLKKEISSMLNKYKNFEKCKGYPLPEHSFYYADEFVPKQLDALKKLQQDIYKRREEDRKRDEIYYNEQLKMMNNMPEYLEINGVPCHKSGLGYKCE